jgi:hypothetical protein
MADLLAQFQQAVGTVADTIKTGATAYDQIAKIGSTVKSPGIVAAPVVTQPAAVGTPAKTSSTDVLVIAALITAWVLFG